MRLILPIFLAFAAVYVVTTLITGDGAVIAAGGLILLVLAVLAAVPLLRTRGLRQR